MFDFDLCILISVFRQAPVLYTALAVSLGQAGTIGYASCTGAFYSAEAKNRILLAPASAAGDKVISWLMEKEPTLQHCKGF